MKLNWNEIQIKFDSGRTDVIKRIFSRPGLSEEKRIIASIACLQGMGDFENLEKILKIVIETQDDLTKAYEILLQGYLFCGYPIAIESFFCLGNAIKNKPDLNIREFAHKPLDAEDELLRRGDECARLVHRGKWDLINNKISDFCPDLGYLMIVEGYGHIISRDGLDIKDRELTNVSSLTALGALRQLNSHIRGARNVGCNEKEIYEAIITTGLWVPKAKIVRALDVLSSVTGLFQDEPIDNLFL